MRYTIVYYVYCLLGGTHHCGFYFLCIHVCNVGLEVEEQHGILRILFFWRDSGFEFYPYMRFTVSFNFLNLVLDITLLCYPGWPPAFGLKHPPPPQLFKTSGHVAQAGLKPTTWRRLNW